MIELDPITPPPLEQIYCHCPDPTPVDHPVEGKKKCGDCGQIIFTETNNV